MLEKTHISAQCRIRDDYNRALVLNRLAPHFRQVLPEALEAARGIQDDYLRVLALNRLAPHLPPQLLENALEVSRGIQHSDTVAVAQRNFYGMSVFAS